MNLLEELLLGIAEALLIELRWAFIKKLGPETRNLHGLVAVDSAKS